MAVVTLATKTAAAAAAAGIIHLSHPHGGGMTKVVPFRVLLGITRLSSYPSSSALWGVASATSDWLMRWHHQRSVSLCGK